MLRWVWWWCLCLAPAAALDLLDQQALFTHLLRATASPPPSPCRQATNAAVASVQAQLAHVRDGLDAAAGRYKLPWVRHPDRRREEHEAPLPAGPKLRFGEVARIGDGVLYFTGVYLVGEVIMVFTAHVHVVTSRGLQVPLPVETHLICDMCCRILSKRSAPARSGDMQLETESGAWRVASGVARLRPARRLVLKLRYRDGDSRRAREAAAAARLRPCALCAAQVAEDGMLMAMDGRRLLLNCPVADMPHMHQAGSAPPALAISAFGQITRSGGACRWLAVPGTGAAASAPSTALQLLPPQELSQQQGLQQLPQHALSPPPLPLPPLQDPQQHWRLHLLLRQQQQQAAAAAAASAAGRQMIVSSGLSTATVLYHHSHRREGDIAVAAAVTVAVAALAAPAAVAELAAAAPVLLVAMAVVSALVAAAAAAPTAVAVAAAVLLTAAILYWRFSLATAAAAAVAAAAVAAAMKLLPSVAAATSTAAATPQVVAAAAVGLVAAAAAAPAATAAVVVAAAFAATLLQWRRCHARAAAAAAAAESAAAAAESAAAARRAAEQLVHDGAADLAFFKEHLGDTYNNLRAGWEFRAGAVLERCCGLRRGGDALAEWFDVSAAAAVCGVAALLAPPARYVAAVQVAREDVSGAVAEQLVNEYERCATRQLSADMLVMVQVVDAIARLAQHAGALERHWSHYRKAAEEGPADRAALLEGILLRTVVKQVSVPLPAPPSGGASRARQHLSAPLPPLHETDDPLYPDSRSNSDCSLMAPPPQQQHAPPPSPQQLPLVPPQEHLAAPLPPPQPPQQRLAPPQLPPQLPPRRQPLPAPPAAQVACSAAAAVPRMVDELAFEHQPDSPAHAAPPTCFFAAVTSPTTASDSSSDGGGVAAPIADAMVGASPKRSPVRAALRRVLSPKVASAQRARDAGAERESSPRGISPTRALLKSTSPKRVSPVRHHTVPVSPKPVSAQPVSPKPASPKPVSPKPVSPMPVRSRHVSPRFDGVSDGCGDGAGRRSDGGSGADASRTPYGGRSRSVHGSSTDGRSTRSVSTVSDGGSGGGSAGSTGGDAAGAAHEDGTSRFSRRLSAAVSGAAAAFRAAVAMSGDDSGTEVAQRGRARTSEHGGGDGGGGAARRGLSRRRRGAQSTSAAAAAAAAAVAQSFWETEDAEADVLEAMAKAEAHGAE
ncbi:hypothetical protein JKP88DRAFT_261181 [Tribonema minus]|uniref:Uncharacterized protein n=1 Tax=Tribonema minus TaxID=303371 RepID=A0A835Z1Q8_9STRA|nr:hypothetical protein JKP88DRAFT_261181 [Tribonema minus]